ncbi:hypothetical protein D3C71_1158790 [compost metagenome]
MLNLHAELAERVNEIVMRTFAERIGICIDECYLRTESRDRHQKAQNRSRVAYIQFLDILRPSAKTLDDDLLIVLGELRAKIRDAAANRITVLAVGGMVDRAGAFGQGGYQQVAGRIVLGGQGADFPVQHRCWPNDNVHDYCLLYHLLKRMFILLCLTGCSACMVLLTHFQSVKERGHNNE